MKSDTRPRATFQLTGSFGKLLTAVAVLTASLLARPLMAQSNQPSAAKIPNEKMTAIETPVEPDAIELGTGPLPARP